jgi:hypothetical protein
MADRRHLHFDAVTAEDVAIRWADERVSHRPEWEARVDACMESLFDGVARNHSVDVAVVRQYSRERDLFADAAVIIGYGVVYVFAAYLLAGRIRRRFPPGEPGAKTALGGAVCRGVRCFYVACSSKAKPVNNQPVNRPERFKYRDDLSKLGWLDGSPRLIPVCSAISTTA